MRDDQTTTLDDLQLLNAKQVAGLLSMHVRSVWRNASSGLLPPPIRIGKSTRWRLADLRNFINGQMESGR